MENYEYKILAALLLIFKGKPLNNSFKVTKFLESVYKTRNSYLVLSEIRKRNHVNFETREGVDHYTITTVGIEFILQYFKEAEEYLLKTYPEVEQITKSLFDNYRNTTNV